MWNNNNQQGYYPQGPSFPGGQGPPPPVPPRFPGAPSGFPDPYGPPQGGPPGGFGFNQYGSSYAPPPGPPQGFPSPPGNYPSPSGAPGYGPPSGFPGAPGGYGPPSGPPQQGYGYQQNAPPPPGGPRPSQYGNAQGFNSAPPSQPAHMPPAQMQSDRSVPQFQYQYSQCNGRKKALCIGINYIGQDAELRGCINDAKNVQRFLCDQYGFNKDDIVMLLDDTQNLRQRPTTANILEAMGWLTRGAQPNDSLFFHYSGHGGQTKDLDGDEADGFDEVIYPVDFQDNGHIVDDKMWEILVGSLPPGCRLTAVFDSCHSGSALDLPYIYSTEGKIKEPNLAAEAGQGLLSAVTSYARGDMGGVFRSVTGLVKTAAGGGGRKADKYAKQTRTSAADVISFSGCKDSQTSADTVEAGSATGAMSWALLASLREQPQQSYQQLLNNLRGLLKGKYSQKPQLSSSHPIDTSIFFII